LVADLQHRGRAARRLDASDEIAAVVGREALGGDVVVMMSNGDFGGLRAKLVAVLGERSE